MKRKICFVTIAVMVLSLIGCGSKESTDDASAQEEKQNKAKIEEAMENEDYDKAKTLTANDSNYKDLYKDLEAYLMVVNDIQMRYVHAKFDDSEDSEFEECAEKLEGIIAVYKEWIDIATRESYEFQGIEPEPKMEGPLPTVWLEIKPGVSWFKYKESALMAVRAYRDVSGYKSGEAYNQLIRWGDERMIDILDSEIESFKRHAEERGLYKDAPEEFYRQIGLILVALKIVRKVYGIHTKKKELESFIFENVTVAWHTKVVDQCYEYPYEDSEEGDLF